MIDVIKKVLLSGVGLAVMTKEKIEELVQELREKGDVTEKEGRELVDELLKRSEEARRDLETRVEKTVRTVVEKIPVATKRDIESLVERIKDLEKKLSKSRSDSGSDAAE